MVDKKIIWFDILTPKQAMLFLAIGEKLKQLGFTPHYTTRNHDYIHDIFKVNNQQLISFGSYGGKTLEGKMLESATRMVNLTKHIVNLEEQPIATIAFSSPDASRVAFGLGIPLLLLNDTAHSKPVGKLTFALAKYLVTPSCIDKNNFIELGASPKIIHTYEGVDEVEYISGENFEKFKELRKEAYENDNTYLVFRPEESFASYMQDKDSKPYLEILQHIIDTYHGEILVFPRYDIQREILLEKFEGQVKIPTNGFYFLNLLSKAEAVITGGGTMARESAMLGIPSVTYFWRYLEPQKYIESRGFPSFSVQSIQDTKKLITKICANTRKYWTDTSNMITKLQKPSDVLIPLMQKDDELKKYF